MKSIFSAFWAESLKIRRSKIFLITILVFLFMPMMMGLLMFVSKNPEISSKLGMIGTKASSVWKVRLAGLFWITHSNRLL